MVSRQNILLPPVLEKGSYREDDKMNNNKSKVTLQHQRAKKVPLTEISKDAHPVQGKSSERR